MAGATVRTLHHYDEIGLLRPSGRSSGYRRYTEPIERLERILSTASSGSASTRSATRWPTTAGDDLDHLPAARAAAGADRASSVLLDGVDQAMEAREMGINLTPEEPLELFGDFDPDATPSGPRTLGRTDAYRSRPAGRRVHQATGAVKAAGGADHPASRRRRSVRPAAAGPAAVAAPRSTSPDRRPVLRPLLRDAHGPCRDVPRGPAVHGDVDQRAGPGQYVHDAIVANASRPAATRERPHAARLRHRTTIRGRVRCGPAEGARASRDPPLATVAGATVISDSSSVSA